MENNGPGSPKQTSTPNSRLIKSRRPIRQEVISPVELGNGYGKFPYIPESYSPSDRSKYPHLLNSSSPSPTRNKRNGRSDTEYDSDDLSDSEYESQPEISTTPSKFQIPKCIGILSIFFVVVAVVGIFGYDKLLPEYQKTLQERFETFEKELNHQHEDFWRSVKVSIKEIPVLKQPRTIIFLYEQKSEKTLNKIIERVTKAALCFLSKCENKPVKIAGASLNSSEIISDHGVIISKYRDQLKQTGVMVVQNLEKVPGKAALAFHSFCDDYNPLVQNALIIFTLKVDKLPPGYPMLFLEKHLLKLWSDIGKDDKFHPLFTRIAGNVLTVQPE